MGGAWVHPPLGCGRSGLCPGCPGRSFPFLWPPGTLCWDLPNPPQGSCLAGEGGQRPPLGHSGCCGRAALCRGLFT